MSSERTTPVPVKVGAKTAVLRGIGKFPNAERDAGEGVKHVAFALRVQDVVKERSELRAAQFDAGVGDGLDDNFQIALSRHCRPGIVQDPEMSFGFFEIGDVDDRADEPNRIVIGEDRVACRRNPAFDTVLKADRPKFRSIRHRVIRVQCSGDCHMYPFAIITMDSRKECSVVRNVCTGRQAEQRLATRIPAKDIGDGVVVPRPNPGRVICQREALGGFTCRPFGSHPLDMSPGSFRHLRKKRELHVGPIVGAAMVDRHKGGKAPLPPIGHADGRADPDALKRLRFFGIELDEVVIDDQRSALAQFGDRLLAEIRELVTTENVQRARGRPIAANGEPVLVIVHIGIGAIGHAKMLAKHRCRDGHDLFGCPAVRRRAPEAIEEDKADFVFPNRKLCAPPFNRGSRALSHLMDQVQFSIGPIARLGVVEVEKSDDAARLDNRHVDERPRGNRRQRLGLFTDARIARRIGNDDGRSAFKVFNVVAVITEMQDSCESLHPRCIPVAADRDRFGDGIDRPIACTTDVEFAPEDFGGCIS